MTTLPELALAVLRRVWVGNATIAPDEAAVGNLWTWLARIAPPAMVETAKTVPSFTPAGRAFIAALCDRAEKVLADCGDPTQDHPDDCFL